YNIHSYASQFFVIIIFGIYGLFSFLLYLIGFRNRKLLYFSLMTLTFIIITSLISDEKIYYLFGSMDIEVAYRLTGISAVLTVILLLHIVNYKALAWWRPLHPYCVGGFLLATFILYAFDMPTIIKYENYLFIFLMILNL